MENKLKIVELEEKYFSEVKDLLVDLQKYIIEIDKYKLNILSADYRNKYFNHMIKDCKNNQGKCFVCVNGDSVLGMVAGFVEQYDEHDILNYSCPKKGIISELIVNKNYRKDGIGTKLVDFMEEYFKSIGCEYIQLDVFAYNDSAKKFYYKNGYEDRMITVFKKLED